MLDFLEVGRILWEVDVGGFAEEIVLFVLIIITHNAHHDIK